MRKYILLMAIWMAAVITVNAQQFPVQVTPQLLPPYSVKISDYYAASGAPKLNLLLLLRDLNRGTLQVRLRMTIESQSVRITTRPEAEFPAIALDPGVPEYISPSVLEPYFMPQNLLLTGISTEQYLNKLPEGFYTFCFEAVDITTGLTVSNKGCSFGWMNLNEPPMLNIPRKGESVEPATSLAAQNILFNWTPRHLSNPTAQNIGYTLTLVELPEGTTNPEADFTAGITKATIELDNGATTYNYTGDALLSPGRKYAWQVRARANAGADASGFKNNGYSEIFWFKYETGCEIPVGIAAENISMNNATIKWSARPEYLNYKVIYRETGNPKAEWFSVITNSNQVVLTDLKPDQDYEFRVGAACEQENYRFSATFPLKTSSTANTVANCGQAPTLIPPAAGWLSTLVATDKIQAYDFEVEVTDVNYIGSDGTFSGAGFVRVPVLSFVKMKVVFERIQVSADKKLVSGKIETTYDPTGSAIFSSNDFTELIDVFAAGYGVGNKTTGEAAGEKKVDFVITNAATSISASLPAAGYDPVSGTLSGGGDITVTITRPDGEPYEFTTQKLPVTIEDKDGNIYQLEKDGHTVTSIGKKDADAEGWLKKMNTGLVDDNKALVEFVKDGSKMEYAFDAWNETYEQSSAFNKEYEILEKVSDGEYHVNAKAIAPGATDYLKAKITIKDQGINAANIKFVNSEGLVYTADPVPGESDAFWIKIVGGPAKDAQEIYAVYPTSDKTLNFGKVLVASYPRVDKKLVLVKVNGTTVSPEDISTVINEIYNPLNIFYTVTGDETFTNTGWDENGDGLLEISDDKFLSVLTSEMKLLNNLYRSDKGVDENTQYLFTVQYNKETAFANNILGDMPRGKQFGYLFTNSADVVDWETKIKYAAAHELGHGAYTLEHTVEYGFDEGIAALNNVMDYPAGSSFSKFQWDYMHDPALVIGFLQDEDQGAYVDKQEEKDGSVKFFTNGPTNFLSPGGDLVSLPDKTQVYPACLDYDLQNNGTNSSGFPNGVLYLFKTANGKEFYPDLNYRVGQFLGYFQITRAKSGLDWKWEGEGANRHRLPYENDASQANNSNVQVTFIHFLANPCNGAHQLWFMDQPYNFVAPPANSHDLRYPQYQTGNKPVGENIRDVGLKGCSSCSGSGPHIEKLKGGAPTAINTQYFKYTEYLGTGESLSINPEDKKTVQDFLRSLGEEFQKKVDVFIYPAGGSKENDANTAYNVSKQSPNNKAIKIEVAQDGTLKIGKENGVEERGVFDYDFFGLGMGNECTAAYVDEMLQKNGASNNAWRFCQKIYYGVKGIVLCKLGEENIMNGFPNNKVAQFAGGFTYELLQTLDVVEMLSGLADMGFKLAEFTVWEAPKLWFNHIKKVGDLTHKMFFTGYVVTVKDVLALTVPAAVISGIEKAKGFGKTLYQFYIDNGNSWRYGQLTMMVVPLVLTLGEYAPVIMTRLTGIMPRLATAAGAVAKVAEFCKKLNRLTDLGFELVLKAGKKCIAPIKKAVLSGGVLRNVSENVDVISEVAGDVETVLDDVNDAERLGNFIDDFDDFPSRITLLEGAEATIVNTALNTLQNDNRLYVAIHGAGEVFELTVNGTRIPVTHKSLAGYLEKILAGKPNVSEVVLLSCADINTAQHLVNKLPDGKTVTAWEGAVEVYENGVIRSEGSACKKFSKNGEPVPLLGNEIPAGANNGTPSGNYVVLGGRKGRVSNFAAKSYQDRLTALQNAWAALYPKIFIERSFLEDVMREYRYTVVEGWNHTLDIASNFLAIDFYKGIEDVTGTFIEASKVVSMKTTTTKNVFEWLKSPANASNIQNLIGGMETGIKWAKKTISYTEGMAEIHIYMPKNNLTSALREEWFAELNKIKEIKFELHAIEDYMTK
ncbi:MAG: fibronectin type III domain-containing protein [Ferruginibacter sp.]